ncbi:hypothetical protein [Alkalihalobacillus trypoxylicola]|uniref:Uncharacterized protein n=1 Tax=Alkalihalobacillus trypoxylicola TaxID=519424 RepID=A0A162DH32_9BACI|nr:hypothetical protein [Alkalihalobacillus trypoxylicola]KYG29614.1 hypothetical protein AZF04_08860 [Alkalihalobacillus trypoxylicola]
MKKCDFQNMKEKEIDIFLESQSDYERVLWITYLELPEFYNKYGIDLYSPYECKNCVIRQFI